MSIINLLVEDVNELLREISEKRKCKVISNRYGKIHFSFKCPYCRTKYKKNGEPTKRSKPVYHYHGSMEKYPENFKTYRSPHCTGMGKKRFEKAGYTEFLIEINDKTLRDENF